MRLEKQKPTQEALREAARRIGATNGQEAEVSDSRSGTGSAGGSASEGGGRISIGFRESAAEGPAELPAADAEAGEPAERLRSVEFDGVHDPRRWQVQLRDVSAEKVAAALEAARSFGQADVDRLWVWHRRRLSPQALTPADFQFVLSLRERIERLIAATS